MVIGKRKVPTWVLIVAALIIGFLIGYEYKAAELRRAFRDAFSSVGEDSNDEAQKPIEDYKFVTHQPGEEITYATQTMKFNSAKSASSISSQYGSPLVASEGTKFVIVNHTVANTTDSPFTYEPYILLDKDNKQYNASSDAIGYIDNYLNVRELAPNVPETGVIVFKVPLGTTQFKFGGLKGQTSGLHVVEFSVD